MTRGINGERYRTTEDVTLEINRAAALFAITIVYLASIAGAWHARGYHEARAIIGAYEREGHALVWNRELLAACVGQNQEVLAYVRSVDEELHEDVVERFPTHPALIAWQEAEGR